MRLIQKIKPWEAVLIIFLVIILVLRKIAGMRILYLNELLAFILFIVLFYLVIIFPFLVTTFMLYKLKNIPHIGTVKYDTSLSKKLLTKSLSFLRAYLPFVILFAIYQILGMGGDLIHMINPYDKDEPLIALDQKLFGFQASVWAQRFINPWLTDILAFIYSLHVILPLIVAIVLYWNKKENQFENYMLGIILVNCIGMLLYFVVPASRPSYHLQYDRPLIGGHIYQEIIGIEDQFKPVTRDAFPSLHVGLSTVVLLFAYKYSKRTFYLLLLPVLLLWFSTIYLRRHYVIDIVAGWMLAIICVYISPKINEWWLRTFR